MATFLNDTFTGAAGTELSAHTGESGATWAEASYANTGEAVLTDANRLRANTDNGDLYYASGVPASADYEVEADLYVLSLIDGQVGVHGRVSTAQQTYYRAVYKREDGQWQLFKAVNGTFTLLGSYTQALSTATSYNLRLRMVGTSIKVFIDDVERISVTDSAVSAAGRAGIITYRTATNSTGIHISNVSATDLVTSPETTVTLKSVTATTATLSATAAVGGTSPYSYQLQRAPDSGGSPGTFANVGSAQTGLALGVAPSDFSDTGLTAETVYHYRVVVTDNASGTFNSDPVAVRPHAATTYYLSASGSDSNNGTTSGTAWQTIAKANAVGLYPGDTLSLNGGDTFAGNLLIDPPFAPTGDKPIAITTHGTGQAIINAADSYGIKMLDCGHVHVGGSLRISGSGLTITGTYPNKDCTSTNTDAGIRIETTTASTWYSGVRIEGAEIDGFQIAGIYFINTLVGATAAHENFLISDCYIHDCGVTAIYTRGTQTAPGLVHNVVGELLYRYGYIVDCRLEDIPGITDYGFDNPGYNYTSGFPFFGINCQDVIVDRCYITNFGDCSYNLAGGGPAGAFFVESLRGIVRRSESSFGYKPAGVDGCAFDVDLGCQDCVIENCYGHDCEGEGILYGTTGGSSTHSGTIIRGNVIERCGGGIRSFGSPGTAEIYNNTISLQTGTMFSDTPANYRNNIFAIADGAGFGIAGTATFYGNCYFVGTGSSFSLDVGGDAYASLAAMQADGYEMLNGVAVGASGDPQFRAINTGTQQLPSAQVSRLTAYDILSGSAAQGCGVSLIGAGLQPSTTDWHGTAITADNTDAGAVAYGSRASGSGGVVGSGILGP